MTNIRNAPSPGTAARIGVAALALLAAAVPSALAAQMLPGARGPDRDFLLATPLATVALRGGMTFARAGGDVLGLARERLTLGPRDFDQIGGALDLGLRAGQRLEAVLTIGYGRAEATSEDREYFEDLDGDDVQDPDERILQQNRFTQVPVTASLRAYLLPRGRSVGQLAWIPARFAPYVGAGGGLVWHKLVQEGDFVDAGDASLTIRSGTLESAGWAPAGHLLAGAELSLRPGVALVAEGRYSFASATPDARSYEGYDSLDLSGLQTTIGFAVRF